MRTARSICLLSGSAGAIAGVGLALHTLGVPALGAQSGNLVGPSGVAAALAGGMASGAMLVPRRTAVGMSWVHLAAAIVMAGCAIAALSSVATLTPGALLAAGLLASIAIRDDGHWSTALLASALVGIGAVRLLASDGTLSQIPSLSDLDTIPRPLALLSILVGSAGLSRAIDRSPSSASGPAWLPLPMFVILASASLGVTLTTWQSERERAQHEAEMQESASQRVLNGFWDDRLEILVAMSRGLEPRLTSATPLDELVTVASDAVQGLRWIEVHGPGDELIIQHAPNHSTTPPSPDGWDIPSEDRRGLRRGAAMTIGVDAASENDPVAVVAIPIELIDGPPWTHVAVAGIGLRELCEAALSKTPAPAEVQQVAMWGDQAIYGTNLAKESVGAGPGLPTDVARRAGGEGVRIVAATQSNGPVSLRGFVGQSQITFAALLAVAALIAMSTGFLQQILRRSVAATRSREGTERLIDAAPMVAVMVTDARGIFTKFNEAAHLITGYSPSEQIGRRPLSSLLSNEELERLHHSRADGAATAALIQAVMREGWLRGEGRQPLRDWEILCSDRSSRRMVLAATEWTEEDGEPGHLIVGVDVTAEKASMAEAQRARIRADEANLRKSDLLADVSHDIKNPLQSIKGFAELLEDGALPDSERADYVGRILKWSDYMDRVVKAIIDEHQVSVGQMSIERIEVQPAQLVADVARLVEPAARAKGLAFSCRCEGDVGAVCLSDKTRLEQIVLNLLTNAIKFTDAGSVQVRCKATAKESIGSLRFTVEVSDTGIGIEPGALKKLFESYGQADPSIHRRFGGSGRGLRISRQLADRLGGTVTAASTPGVGTTFTLECNAPLTSLLPGIARPEPSAPPGAPADPVVDRARRPLEGIRVLLADDGPDLQRLFAKFFEKAGAEATVVEDGDVAMDVEARMRGAGTPPDMVILDLDMVRVGGTEAARMMRTSGCRAPLVALTGVTSSSLDPKTVVGVFDDVITKPIGYDALVELCLRLKRAASSPTAPGA